MKSIIVAKAVVLDAEGKLLALRRSQTDDRRPLQWDIPGGWVEEGEDFAEATAREAQEEAGISVDPKKLELVFTKTAIKKPKDEPINVMWLFFIGKAQNDAVTLSYEHVEYKWMTIDEALAEFEYPLHKELFKHLKDNDLLADLVV